MPLVGYGLQAARAAALRYPALCAEIVYRYFAVIAVDFLCVLFHSLYALVVRL